MIDSSIKASAVPAKVAEKSALIWVVAAAVLLSGSAAAGMAVLDGGTSAIVLAGSVALAGLATGHLIGHKRHWHAAHAAREVQFRVADELVQYKAFTRLLRDQGNRIIETTSGAATDIVAAMNEMDATIDRMRTLIDRVPADHAPEYLFLLEAVSAPVLQLLGHLQFQDVTQQQIAFLVRLSLLVDEHMTQLANQLEDRCSGDRIDRFKELFDAALGDCVMDSQRDDHHAASGLDVREDAGLRLQMF